jgi:hypothetical protein
MKRGSDTSGSAAATVAGTAGGPTGQHGACRGALDELSASARLTASFDQHCASDATSGRPLTCDTVGAGNGHRIHRPVSLGRVIERSH